MLAQIEAERQAAQEAHTARAKDRSHHGEAERQAAQEARAARQDPTALLPLAGRKLMRSRNA